MKGGEQKLVLAASKLSQEARTSWEDFLKAFDEYSSEIKDECVQSPMAMLATAQGRAQQTVRIHKVLTDCRATSAKIVAEVNQRKL